MKTIQWILAGVATGVIAVAFRDLQRRRWLAPALPGGRAGLEVREPVLGYDGMDQETLLEWIPDADLDQDTVRRMLRYEQGNLGREPVLNALEDMLA